MDVSIFIANRKTFWMWIFAPLILRFVLVSAVFGLTEKSLSGFAEESAFSEAVAPLLAECEANKKLLMRYEVDPLFPLNEQLYQLMAEKNARHGLALDAHVSGSPSKSVVVKNELKVSGEVPSVYIASQFIADMLADPLLSIREGHFTTSVKRLGRGRDRIEQAGKKITCTFEKVAIRKASGGGK